MTGLLTAHRALAEELAAYSRLCYDRRLVGAAGGNLSARIPGTEHCLVTASGVSLRDVTPENLVVVDLQGNVVEGPAGRKPSKEIGFHLAIFRNRPAIGAVVHVHPPYATVFATSLKPIPLVTVSAILKLKQGPIVPVADPGSKELCDNVTKAVQQAAPETTVLLMEKHGVLAFRPTLCEAFDDAELAEDTAKIAHLLGPEARRERVIDLSIPLNESLPFYPTDPPFRKFRHVTLEEGGANVSRLEIGAHAGTHVDAPLHFLAEGADVATLPPSAFMGEAIVIDTVKAPGGEVTLDDLAGADIRAGDIVLFRTGWETRAGTPEFFAGVWPGVLPEVVSALISKGVKAIGGDFPSIDSPAGIEAGVPSHKKALGAGLPVFEALVNLAGLDGKRFQFIGLPLRIEDGEASPIRAVAVVID